MTERPPLLGEYHLSLTGNRLPIPQSWLPRFEGGCWVALVDQHLDIYVTRDRAAYGAPAEVSGDHLELPQELVGATGIGSEVALVGVFDKAEVWDPEVWAAEVERAERDAHPADMLGDAIERSRRER